MSIGLILTRLISPKTDTIPIAIQKLPIIFILPLASYTEEKRIGAFYVANNEIEPTMKVTIILARYMIRRKELLCSLMKFIIW